jgi:hypothetical protein
MLSTPNAVEAFARECDDHVRWLLCNGATLLISAVTPGKPQSPGEQLFRDGRLD